ncbi:MAG: hypothetical protein WDM87_04690 [Terracidiphilus sp.]
MTLIVGLGVTLFASRDPALFAVSPRQLRHRQPFAPAPRMAGRSSTSTTHQIQV